jgi:predicted MPP superfamily phosphohydrolase
VRALLSTLVAAIALVLLYGVWEAAQAPRLVRYSIAMPGLSRPLRVLLLSDTHASAVDMRPARLRAIVAQVNARQPDIVVLAGDYVSGDPENWSSGETVAALAPFAGLRARLRVFAVLGNHDDPVLTRFAFAGTGVQLLVGQRADAGPLQIVGSDDIMRGSPAVEAMRRAIRRGDRARPMLVVAHEPSFFPWLTDNAPRRTLPAGMVMLVGHTHGQQIYIPGLGRHIFLPYYANHRRGVYRAGGNTMLVTSGVGTTAIPLRINVPPEIVELSLLPAVLPAPVQAGRNSGTDR